METTSVQFTGVTKFLDQKGWLVEDWAGKEATRKPLRLIEARTRYVKQDLTKYVSSVQAVLLHPLPGIPAWQDVLGNALKSAHEALVVTVPLPFSDPYGTRVVDGVYQWNHNGLLVWFEHWDVREEQTAEFALFYVSKR
jgi:hypothetical protein